MFNLQKYKELFSEAQRHMNKNSKGQINFEAVLVEPNFDGSNYKNIGFVHGPSIHCTKLPEAANDAHD
jgi:hypothetical protein